MAKDEDENILYELLVHNEWTTENAENGNSNKEKDGQRFYNYIWGLPMNICSHAITTVKSMFKNSTAVWDSTKLLNTCADWHLGVGGKGAVIAILQDTSLEIRVKKDEYLSVVGKNLSLPHEPNPAWRKICWSPECSMVAVSFSNGVVEIFNTIGASLFTIYPPRFSKQTIQQDNSHALAGLFFSTVRTEGMKWTAEVILVDFQGLVRSYFVCPTEGYQENHFFSFSQMYPAGISSVTIIGSLFVVAGATKYATDPKLRSNGLGHGLTLWRMLNEYPFYKQVPTIDEDEYTVPKEGLLQRWLPDRVPYDTIFRLRASPLGSQVVALHASGSISLWDVPSLRKRRFWLLEDQPNYDAVNTLTMGRAEDPVRMYPPTIRNHLTDVKWWDEKSITLARMSGAVTICSVFTLKNLLGDSPEFFEGVPQISDVSDRCFLALEMEVHATRDEEEESKIELGAQIIGKSVENFVLQWIIGAEETPEFSVPTVNSRTFRLLSLKATTPQELYLRKIQSEEYGEALALAQKYDLDCDAVYQRQWHTTPMTVVSIQDYLYKIKKRSWVIQECLTRIPEDFDAARELLLYGLRGTELDTIVAIGNGTNKDEFYVSDLSVDFEEDLDEEPEETEERARVWMAEDLRKRKELLSQIDFQNLTTEQISVIKSRQLLLKYYDRFGTNEILQGLGEGSVEKFNYMFYESIRDLNALDVCSKFAREGNARGVDVLFTYHGDETLPHRLAILSNFPPMMNPYDYMDLLPECDLSGQVFDSEEERFRDPDWCEDEICRKATGTYDPDPSAYLYKDHSYLESFRGKTLTGELVGKWYILRAREIEQDTYFVDVALDFVRIGKENNIPGLEPLIQLLDSLEILTYSVGHSSLSLSQFESLSDFEKLKLFMSTSNPSNFIENLRCWAIPFLDQLEKSTPDVRSSLLKNFVVWISKDNLSYTLKAIQNSQGERDECVFKCPEDLLNVAIDSIYSCEKANQLPKAFAIVESLPIKDIETASETLLSLHDEIDVLEDYLTVAEILSHYEILKTISELKTIQQDYYKSRQIFVQMANSCIKRDKIMKQADWRKLLEDCMEIQQKVLYAVEPVVCYEVITSVLLTSGIREYIDSSREFLETRGSNPDDTTEFRKLPYLKVIPLVLNAAREYFNSSDNYENDSMQLARYTLRIIETEHPEILDELDLITSLSILPDVGVYKLPLQVRKCEDRLSLIKEALVSSPDNYLQGSRLLHLSKLLRVCGQNSRQRETQVLSLIVEHALKACDYSAASIWCDQLMSEDYGESWPICAKLGQCEHFNDLKLRAKLLDFALTHSEMDSLESLLKSRNEVELRSLYLEARIQMQPKESSAASDEEFEDANSIPTEESFDEFLDTEENNGGIRKLLEGSYGVTKDLLSATASTTSKLTSSVTSQKFWKAASGWVQPLGQTAAKLMSQKHMSPEKKALFASLKCHAFYQSLWPHAEISSLGVSYRSYAMPFVSTTAKHFCLQLLKISLIERTLNEHVSSTSIDSCVIQELGLLLLSEDIQLGLSFLLTVPTPEEVQQIFESLPQTELWLQIAMYYYCLQLHPLIHPWLEPKHNPLYYNNPYNVIDEVTDYMSTSQSESHLEPWAEGFLRTQKLLNQLLEGQSLQHLGAMVDIERFLTDPAYKMDSVLGLAMTSEESVLQYSLDLAQKYDVSKWEVFATHLQHLFDSNECAQEIEATINDHKMGDAFADNSEKFVEFLQKNVLFTISGVDYERLRLFYSLVDTYSRDEKASVFLNILEYLNEIDRNKLKLDFKTLIDPESNLDDHIAHIVNEENIEVFAEVAQMFSKTGIRSVNSGMIYFKLAQKKFFADHSECRTKKQWMARFSSAISYSELMPDDILLKLIKSLILSIESLIVPLDFRISMLQKLEEQCQNLAKENIKESVTKVLAHLKSLNTPSFQNLLDQGGDARKYAIELQLSGEDEGVLNDLARKILLEGSSLELLREILSLYPENLIPVAEDIFMDVYRTVMENLKNSRSENSDQNLEALESLFKEFQKSVDSCGYLLDEEEILDAIREFAADENIDIYNRIGAFTLAITYFTTTEQDEKCLQNLKTGGILKNVFQSNENGTDKKDQDLETDTGRSELFSNLYDSLATYDQAKSLFNLLVLWPPFENNQTNPLEKISLKILEIESTPRVHDFINDVSAFAKNKNQLPLESVERIVKKLIDVSALEVAAKCSIRHNHENSIRLVMDVYKNMESAEIDDELVSLVVTTDNIECILSTPLYGAIIERLLENNDVDMIEKVSAQLRLLGKFVEASSLELQLSHLPESLKSISHALLQSFGKLL